MRRAILMAIKTVFFDAAGTLIGLRRTVGEAYAEIAGRHGISVAPGAINAAFRAAWRSSPAPLHPPDKLPDDDDRGWWRSLVATTFEQVLEYPLAHAELEPVFSELYDHFAGPDAWLVFDDVLPTLQALHGHYRLLVLSNFDRRLRRILAGHGLDRYFDGMVISSEAGASKPHPRIFEAAMKLAMTTADQCLHVGDDLKADVEGAVAAGMQAFQLKRPEQGLGGLFNRLG